MCNINVLIKNTERTEEPRNYVSLLEQATGHSYITNNHADGVWFSGSGLLVKQDDKIQLSNFKEHIEKSRVIICHQRISTSGFNAKYHHPFMSDNFVMVHNGVVSSKAKEGHSDTHVLFEEVNAAFTTIEKETKELPEYTRHEAVMKTIKKVFDELHGSYSICLFDRVSGALYYFKNYGCSITVLKTDDMMYIGTQDVTKLVGKCTEIKIESYKIYYVMPKEWSFYVATEEISMYSYKSTKTYEEPTTWHSYRKTHDTQLVVLEKERAPLPPSTLTKKEKAQWFKANIQPSCNRWCTFCQESKKVGIWRKKCKDCTKPFSELEEEMDKEDLKSEFIDMRRQITETIEDMIVKTDHDKEIDDIVRAAQYDELKENFKKAGLYPIARNTKGECEQCGDSKKRNKKFMGLVYNPNTAKTLCIDCTEVSVQPRAEYFGRGGGWYD